MQVYSLSRLFPTFTAAAAAAWINVQSGRESFSLPAHSSALNCCNGDRAHFDSWLQTASAKGRPPHTVAYILYSIHTLLQMFVMHKHMEYIHKHRWQLIQQLILSITCFFIGQLAKRIVLSHTEDLPCRYRSAPVFHNILSVTSPLYINTVIHCDFAQHDTSLFCSHADDWKWMKM